MIWLGIVGLVVAAAAMAAVYPWRSEWTDGGTAVFIVACGLLGGSVGTVWVEVRVMTPGEVVDLAIAAVLYLVAAVVAVFYVAWGVVACRARKGREA